METIIQLLFNMLEAGFELFGDIRDCSRKAKARRLKLESVATYEQGKTSMILGSVCNAVLGLFRQSDPEASARAAASAARQVEILAALRQNRLSHGMQTRLTEAREGKTPWLATLSPAELRLAREGGIRPIAAVSATCWMHYGYSWTKGHAQGWQTAIARLKAEAVAAGANAVLDVKMRTVPVDIEGSMDFSLVGTAVKVDGLEASTDPIIATVPALEFLRLIRADIVPVGIAVGAEYQWITDWQSGTNLLFAGNTECMTLTGHWKTVRDRAIHALRQNVREMGNGALAHVNFSQMFKQETERQPPSFLVRHIVIATVIDDAPPLPAYAVHRWPEMTAERLPDFQMAVDLHAGASPLNAKRRQHQSYASNEQDGPI